MNAWPQPPFVELSSFPNAVEANLVAGILRGEGIEVELFGVHTNSVLPHLHDAAVRLMVRETALYRARELLKDYLEHGES